MKCLPLLLLVVALGSAPGVELHAATADKPKPDAVLAITARYIKRYEPKLQDKDRQTTSAMKLALQETRTSPTFLDSTVSDLVNQMTVALAGMKSLEALIVDSALLVQVAPASPRAANLLGAVLQAGSMPGPKPLPGARPKPVSPGGALAANSCCSLDDARVVAEYALKLSPKSPLALVNLANVYFDLYRDEDAKKLLDQAVLLDLTNHAAHKGLALYWYRRQNWALYRDELARSAQSGGFVHHDKEKEVKDVDEEEVQEGDSLDAARTKTDELAKSVPLSTADAIQADFPEAAAQIRARYGKLIAAEKVKLPMPLQAKLNSVQDYTRGEPVIEQWVKSADDKFKQLAGRQVGVDTTASDAVQEAQAMAAGQKDLAEQLAGAQQTIEAMKNVPGMTAEDQKEIANAMKELNKAAGEQGQKLPAPGAKRPQTPSAAVGRDSGGLYSDSNYYAYERIYRSYTIAFRKYWDKYEAEVNRIIEVYTKKADEENKRDEDEMTRIQEGREKADKNGEDTSQWDIAEKRELLRHKQKLNLLAEDYYHEWVNYYMPEYGNKMKPMAERYWYVCALYIKNMSNPKVMKEEYFKCMATYGAFAGRAVGHIGAGKVFKYAGATDEEEAALIKAIRAAEDEAKARQPEFKQAFKTPDTGWSDWIEDKFSLKLDAKFLSLKVTGKTIEFEAWAFGPDGRIKLNYLDGKMETYSGVTAKFSAGIEVCGETIGKVEARQDIVGKFSKWDLSNGDYSDGWQIGGKGEAKVGIGPFSLTGEAQVDPEMNAKTAVKASVTVGSAGPAKASVPFTFGESPVQ